MAQDAQNTSNSAERAEEDDWKQALGADFDFGAIEAAAAEAKQEYAADAIDYEDIGNDDLPEEEESEDYRKLESLKATQASRGGDTAETSFTANGDADANFDDLFGEGGASLAVDQVNGDAEQDLEALFGGADDFDEGHTGAPVQSIEDEQAKELADADGESGDEEADEVLTAAALEQRRLFDMSRHRLQGDADLVLAPAENQEELVAKMFPGFKQGKTLKFTELLPSGRARYVGKTPAKPPKPVIPTKINLNIAGDQEKEFRLLAGSHKRNRDEYDDNIVLVDNEDGLEEGKDEELDEDSDFENEKVGGFSWEDFQVVCEDWDVPSIKDVSPPTEPEIHMEGLEDDLFADLDPVNDWQSGRASAKRQKLEPRISDIFSSVSRYQFPAVHDPLRATARIAREVVLDLNDPQLLLHEYSEEEMQRILRAGRQAQEHGDKLAQTLASRYNISNDHEYDLLKENQQSKSRNTIGSLNVSHSMPALRLQWPYYKTRLEKQESRSFHRPVGYFPKSELITFRPTRVLKKKHVRGQEATAIFNKTEDLSLGDNSHVLLLEYSEQYPLMMSNFGMNSRLINYYRRKDAEDQYRPKLDIGEPSVLQPQDTSPLTIFGHIYPGETTPAIYNGMYKAPLFEQHARPTDFIVIRNATGVDGSNWYLRNIEYTRVVGQQLPSVEVPGPNARKVTTAAKNRLKMVSYRLLKRKKPHRITVGEITPHILDPSGAPSNDMQNRQKLKEFMKFNKEHKEWEMPDNGPIPDEDAIRALIAPEDVCLLEAMQVGQQQLEDAGGLSSNVDMALDDDEEDIEKEGETLEQQLVPWHTTKNFIQAANNKAMLQLHGEGDPTKRGEAFSMLKISMKGGFRAEGEPVQATLDEKAKKDLGGHSYNVAKQQESYDRSVRRIWEKQKESLSSHIEPDLAGDEDEEEEEDEPVLTSMMDGPDVQTMRTQKAPTKRIRDDESASQFSHMSLASQPGQTLKITRRVKNRFGQEEEQTEIVRDPRVITQYLKLRRQKEQQAIDVNAITKEEMDKNPEARKAVERELARLERNKDRRLGREKQKAGFVGDTSSPGPATPAADGGGASAPAKAKGKGSTGGTGRKCANCGQIGHIKTNKNNGQGGSASKREWLCPKLNGTMQEEDGFGSQSFTVSTAHL